MMAENALRNRPPVGRFREFVLARKNGEKATLDLKVQGLTPFVDGARLLALANGIDTNNTLERFRQLVDKEVIERLDGAAYEEAYHFIQQTRMQQHQLQTRENCRTPTASIPTASIISTGASSRILASGAAPAKQPDLAVSAMSLFSWLRPASPVVPADFQQRLAKLPAITELGECTLREQRWVVLDLETTGLNLNKDRVLSIGAVVIEDGAIDFSQRSNAPCSAGS